MKEPEIVMYVIRKTEFFVEHEHKLQDELKAMLLLFTQHRPIGQDMEDASLDRSGMPINWATARHQLNTNTNAITVAVAQPNRQEGRQEYFEKLLQLMNEWCNNNCQPLPEEKVEDLVSMEDYPEYGDDFKWNDLAVLRMDEEAYDIIDEHLAEVQPVNVNPKGEASKQNSTTPEPEPEPEPEAEPEPEPEKKEEAKVATVDHELIQQFLATFETDDTEKKPEAEKKPETKKDTPKPERKEQENEAFDEETFDKYLDSAKKKYGPNVDDAMVDKMTAWLRQRLPEHALQKFNDNLILELQGMKKIGQKTKRKPLTYNDIATIALIHKRNIEVHDDGGSSIQSILDYGSENGKDWQWHEVQKVTDLLASPVLRYMVQTDKYDYRKKQATRYRLEHDTLDKIFA